MALTVGELVAYIRADGTQFDQQIDASGRKFTGFTTLVGAGVKATATAFAGVLGATTGLGVALVKVGADYNRLQQSSRAALATLLGGAEAANAQMDKLDEFARSSPFAKQVFITAQQQLIGFGVAADKVLPTLDAIQNAVAATGGSGDQILALTDIFAKIQSSAKITAEDLNRFGTYGVDAATMIGSQMGLTGQQIREKISEGSLDAQKALDALTTGMTERFGGATANIKQQFDGALDRIKGAWRDIGSIIATPFIDPHGGGRAVEWANKVADALRALEQKAKPLVDLLVQRFKPGLDAVTPALDKVRSGINAWDLSKVNGQLDTLTKYAPLIAPVAAGLAALGGAQVLGPLAKFVPALNPVVAGVAALIAASPGLRTTGEDFLKALSPLVPVAGNLAVVLADALLAVIDELAPSARDLLLAGADVAVMFGTSLAPAVVATAEALGPVAHTVAEVVSWVSQLPTPILGAVTAFVALNMLGVPGIVQGITTKIAALATAAKGLSFSSIGTSLMSAFGGPIGLAIAGITAAITYFASQQAEAKRKTEELTASLDQQTAAVTENTRELVYNRLEAAGAFEKAAKAGIDGADVLTAALDKESDAWKRIHDTVNNATNAYYGAGGQMEVMDSKTAALLELFVILDGTQDDLAQSTEELKNKQEILAGAHGEAADETNAQVDALKALKNAQDEAAGATLSLRESVLRAEDAQQSMTDAVARSAAVNADAEKSEEDKAAAVRDAEKAQLNYVSSTLAQVDAMQRSNATAEEMDATLRAARDQLVNSRMAMGDSRNEAEKYADSLGLIPNKVMTEIELDAAAAQTEITRFITQNTGKRIRIYVDAAGGTSYSVPGTSLKFNDTGGVLEFYRSGGLRPLTPMQSVAQIVGANTWRVIGDRPRGDEGYIPIENTARSHAILDEVAHRMGRVVLPMESGGVLTTRQSSIAPTVVSNAAPVTVNVYGVDSNNAEDVAREIGKRLRRAQWGGAHA